jgi:cytochrome c553
MKVSSLKSAVPAAIFVIAFSFGAQAKERVARHQHNANVGGKIGYCTDCHGSSGQGYRGYYPIPRIAGQTTEYLESQLRAFVDRSRGRSIPINMARVHGVGSSTRMSVASHFQGLNPRPLSRGPGGPKGAVAEGRRIYEEGVPESNVPACGVCHGPDGHGEGPNPRLAGQLYPYTVKVLRNWTKERGLTGGGQNTTDVMTPIAQSLTKAQIQAVSAYLSYQK